MAVAITATTQDVYPPRVALAVTGMTLGDQMEIMRVVGGTRTAVRGGTSASVDDTAWAVIDAELPFGVPVTYVVVINGADADDAGPTSYTLPGGKVVLSDAITGLSAEVVIMAAGDRARTRDSARYRAGGRNIMVSRPPAGPEGSYELFLDTTVAFEQTIELLNAATGAVVQLRQPGGYDGVDAYLAVDKNTETRWSQDGSDPRRLLTIEYAEVEAWAPDLPALGFTYGDVETFYTGLIYADAEGDFSTYLEAILADYS